MRLLRARLILCIFVRVCSHGRAEVWTQNRDPHGFVFSFPPGWTAGVGTGATIVAQSADRKQHVLIEPFTVERGESSYKWLRGAPARLTFLLTAARLERLERTRARPDESLAAVSYRAGASEGRAILLCSIAGRAGMLYAIAAPASSFAKSRDTLVRILSSFRFTAPTSTGGSAGPAPAPHLDFVRWADPREGAFSIEAPRGWQVQGGLIRRNALDPRQTVNMVSPDQQVLVRVGDASIPGFVPPNSALATAGFAEGSTYSIGAGIDYIVARFIPGAAFARWYLQRRIGPPYSDLRIEAEKDREDIAKALRALMPEGPVHYTLSVGEVDFTCSRSGAPMRGICYGLTVMQSSGGFNVWGGYPVGFVAPPGKVAVADAALRRALSSWRMEPSWISRQSDTAAQVSRIAARTNAEISKAIDASYWHRQAVIDDVSRKRSNATLGLVDLRDPDTGETFRAADGHNYYWRKGGAVVGNESGDLPDVDFTPLRKW